MACYHLNAGIISRGKGQSIAAAVAYISGEQLYDSYEGKKHNYTYRQDVVYKELVLPPVAPREFLDRQIWLDALNRIERRYDAQMARSIKVALPNELTREEQICLVKNFISEYFTENGMSADMAIHSGLLEQHRKPVSIEAAQERRDNPHAHIILPFRTVNENGFCKTKTTSRQMNNPSYLQRWRMGWAEMQNKEFERLGLTVRVSHESLAEQGIDREPTRHLGAATIALEQRGVRTERGDQHRSIIMQNRMKELERQHHRHLVLERNREIERIR